MVLANKNQTYGWEQQASENAPLSVQLQPLLAVAARATLVTSERELRITRHGQIYFACAVPKEQAEFHAQEQKKIITTEHHDDD